MNLKKLLDGYSKKTSALDAKLAELGKQAEALKSMCDQRPALEAKIEDYESRIADGQHRIEALKADWFEAQFLEDWDKQNQLQDRRYNIKAEVEGLEQEREAAQQELQKLVVDSREVAKVAAAIDTVSVPDFFGFLDQLRMALQDKSSDQRTSINKLKNVFGQAKEYMTDDDYHDARNQLEETWPNAESRRAASARRDAAKQAQQERWARRQRIPTVKSPLKKR